MARARTAGGAGRTVILPWALGLVVAAVSLTACRDEPPLQGAEGRLRVSQETVTFPASYPTVTREVEVRVTNAGRAPLQVSWTPLEAPFSAASLPERLEAGQDLPARLRFTPDAPGTYQTRLTAVAPGGGIVTLELTGEALPVPACPDAPACHAATFDLTQEKCIETELPDGTACDPGNACISNATCTQGRCKGTELACDDGNACTTDVCHPLDGCTSVPAPPCPGDGKCQVGTCDPVKGCGLAPAPDGTFCGSARGCDDADVCVEGACVRRNLPDGYVCADASPCQGEGHCRGPVCERPTATALTPDWTYDARPAAEDLHDVLVGPEGDITLTGFFAQSLLDAAGARPVRAPVAGRRCMLWNDRLLCMDLPASGQVSLLDRATGAARWTFDLAKSRPDFAALSSTLFMARLAVMQPDRLAALFEAYPAGQDRNSLCRRYFLVVLDAFGQLVSAQALEDPLLSECNHPHPFGVVSDAKGDLYIAFSRTANQGAPLAPGAPTLLMSLNQDGVQRWRKTEAFVAGELAVVNGLLLNEHGQQALRTQDGTGVEGTLFFEELHRPLATSEVLMTSPERVSAPGEPERWRLQAYGLPDLKPRWTYGLRDGQVADSRELRLASWTSRAGLPPRTVALGMGSEGSGMLLYAVDARDGSEAFQCPVAAAPRFAPAQLMELGPDNLVVMDGASTCGECDLPFAYSRSRFQRFALPGLKPANEPWPGTFGGPGHSHHENPVRAAPSPSP